MYAVQAARQRLAGERYGELVGNLPAEVQQGSGNVPDAAGSHEDPDEAADDEERKEPEEDDPLDGELLLREGVVAVQVRTFGAHGQAGERRAERYVDPDVPVHRPAGRIQYGGNVPLPELEPGDQHGREGDGEDDAEYAERNPEAEPQEGMQQAAYDRCNARKGNADCRDGAHIGFLRVGDAGRGTCGCILRLFHGTCHFVRDLAFRICRRFCNLFLNEAGKLLVGAEECLADADRVVHDFDDCCVPVVAVLIVEKAVPSHDDVVVAARTEQGGNLHLFTRFPALAVAVHEVALGERRHGGVLGRIRHAEAEAARAAVYVERTALEYGGAVRVVEVLE